MSEWQPIETAPKDGTVVMFHVPGKATPVICRADDFWYGRNHAEDRGFAYWLDGATHWHPLLALPAPPQTAST